MILYLDSSALVKLVQRESESDALRRYLGHHRSDHKLTSALARVEVVRAVSAAGAAAIGMARRQLARVDQLAMDAELLDDAAMLNPAGRLRSLDAIHLASALAVGTDLRAVLTYDTRMIAAAEELKLAVAAPS